MIGNSAKRSPGEGDDHYNTKVLVANLADKHISTLAKEIGYNVLTLHEFWFIPIRLDPDKFEDCCDRCYVGDVVLLFFSNRKLYTDLKNKAEVISHAEIQKKAEHIINHEIDGKKGHSTVTEKKKNAIRDEELLKRFNIQIHRIPVYSKKERINFIDVLKEDKILAYYFKHLPKVIA